MEVKELYEKLEELIKENKSDYDIEVQDSEYGRFVPTSIEVDDMDRTVLIDN